MTELPSSPLPFAERIASGKVRDLYALGDQLLLVASDRISAFDVVMAEPVPGKGAILTEVSRFWFGHLSDIVPNHLLTTDVEQIDAIPEEYREALRGRSTLCRRAEPLPVEWVVRGHLTGGGWADYQATGSVSGITLPAGLQHASRIEPPLLTPSTKAASGHDEPISFSQVVDLVGREIAEAGRDAALELYDRGCAHAAERGIVIADTKFEFGVIDGTLTLIDECLTPDSSRFWRAEDVRSGAKPRSFDKQILRDYLVETGWDKSPPPPPLPGDIIDEMGATYRRIRDLLLG